MRSGSETFLINAFIDMNSFAEIKIKICTQQFFEYCQMLESFLATVKDT